MATIIRPDGARENIDLDKNPQTRLSQLQAAVGGLIEQVYSSEEHNEVMYCNEEFLYVCSDLNLAATLLARTRIGTGSEGFFILGNVVVCLWNEVNEEEES
jgi:hypothetical protein